MTKLEAELREENEQLKREITERLEILTSPLPPELYKRAKLIWDAAFDAHSTAEPGEPGPVALIAVALKDAEAKGATDLVESMRRAINAKNHNGR